MTHKSTTLYARISCPASFLVQRSRVKLIYIRLIKKKCFLPTGTLERGKFR